ncbi:uncharacterized protein TNCV_847551 [Trichonephila clavipes]|nr:uncharacterized protein TNCV_847551 [Trichonephila clavipes]
MVFQERMVHGEPTEARLEEILQNGKEYLPRAMYITDENSLRWQTMYNYVKSGFPHHHGNSSQNVKISMENLLTRLGKLQSKICTTKEVFFYLEYKSSTAFRCNSFILSVSSRVIMWFEILLPHQHYPLAAMVGKDDKLYFRLVDVGALLGHSKVYGFAKSFDNLVIQGKDVLAVHKLYPVMTQKSKLVTPDVFFNILNNDLSSLVTSFATSLNVGFALVENPVNLFVGRYKASPVLRVQDSRPQFSLGEKEGPRLYPKGAGHAPGANIRPSAELAERFYLPERIPTPPAEPERIPSQPAEPERMPTPPVEPERMPTPPDEPERMPTPPAER